MERSDAVIGLLGAAETRKKYLGVIAVGGEPGGAGTWGYSGRSFGVGYLPLVEWWDVPRGTGFG